MSKGVDDLLRFLVEQVALQGETGASTADIARYAASFYADDGSSASTSQVDRALLGQIWSWLLRHPDVTLDSGIEGAQNWNLDEVEAYNSQLASRTSSAPVKATKRRQSSVQDVEQEVRLLASEEQMWFALTGHGPDHKHLPALEFSCLSVIGAHRENGVVQPLLTRLTGQDKRSLPSRTDKLVEKGYIVKRRVLSGGSITSLCILRRFAQDELPTVSNVHSYDGSWVQHRFSKYEAMIREALEVIQEKGIAAWQDLRALLDIPRGNVVSKRVLEALRRFEYLGCIERVQTIHTNSLTAHGRTVGYRSFRFLRQSTADDWNTFFSLGREDPEWASSFKDVEKQADEDDAHEGSEAEKNPSSSENFTALSQPHLPLWSPDRNIANVCFEAISRAGTSGAITADACETATGSFSYRSTHGLINSISNTWLADRPLELSVLRDAAQAGKKTFYKYYTLATFQAAVAEGLTSWEAVNRLPPTSYQLKQYAEFEQLASNRFFGKNGCATLSDAANAVMDKAKKGSKLGYHTSALSADNSQTQAHDSNQPMSVSMPKPSGRGLASRKYAAQYTEDELSAMAPEKRKRILNSIEMGRRYHMKKHQARIDSLLEEGKDYEDATYVLQSELESMIKGPEDSGSWVRLDVLQEMMRKHRASLYLPSRAAHTARYYSSATMGKKKRKYTVQKLPKKPVHRLDSEPSQQTPGIDPVPSSEPQQTLVSSADDVSALNGPVEDTETSSRTMRSVRASRTRHDKEHLKAETTSNPNPPEGEVNEVATTEIKNPQLMGFGRRSHTTRTYDEQYNAAKSPGSKIIFGPLSRLKTPRRGLGPLSLLVIFKLASTSKSIAGSDKAQVRPRAARANDSSTIAPPGRGISNEQGDANSDNVASTSAGLHGQTHSSAQAPGSFLSRKRRSGLSSLENFHQSSSGGASLVGRGDIENDESRPLNKRKRRREGSPTVDEEGLAGTNNALSSAAVSGSPGRTAAPDVELIATVKTEPGNQEILSTNAPTRTPPSSARDSRSSILGQPVGGVSRYGGSAVAEKKKIILKVLEQCHGVFPGDREMWYPFTSELIKRQAPTKPDTRTIVSLIKQLVSAGKVRQIGFNFRTRKGEVKIKHILTLPNVDADSKEIDKMRQKMIDVYPRLYMPEEAEIHESLRRHPETWATKSNWTDKVIETSQSTLPIPRDALQDIQQAPAQTAKERLKLWHESIAFKLRQEIDRLQLEDDEEIDLDSNAREAGVEQMEPAAFSQNRSTDPDSFIKGKQNRIDSVAALRKTDVDILRNRYRTDQLPSSASKQSSTAPLRLPRLRQRPRAADKPFIQVTGNFHIIEPNKFASGERRLEHDSLQHNQLDTEQVFFSSTGCFGTFLQQPSWFVPSSLQDIIQRKWHDKSQLRISKDPTNFNRFAAVVNSVERWEHEDPSARSQADLGQTFINIFPNSQLPSLREDSHIQDRGARMLSGTDAYDVLYRSVRKSKRRADPTPDISRKRQHISRRKPEYTVDEQTLALAVLISRSLFQSADDRNTNWSVVRLLIGQRLSIEEIVYRWRSMRLRWNQWLDLTAPQFEDQYLLAYQDGKVPLLDYEDLSRNDWDSLISWSRNTIALRDSQSVQGFETPEEPIVHLPATRKELDSKVHLLPVQMSAKDAFNIRGRSAPALSREDAASQMSFVIPQQLPRSGKSYNIEDPVIAQSWVRSNILTPVKTFQPVAAAEKLQSIAELNIDEAVKSLLDKKVLVQSARSEDETGRSFDLGDKFLDALRVNIDLTSYSEATRFKEFLDNEFSQSGYAMYDYDAAGGASIAIINMLANARIRLVPENIKCETTDGDQDSGYRARLLDKASLHFDMRIEPTDKYLHGNPLLPLPPLPQAEPVLSQTGLDKTPLPAWIDIHGNEIANVWQRALCLVLSVLAVRPGLSATTLAELYAAPSLGAWELELIIAWALQLGICRRLEQREQHDLDHEHEQSSSPFSSSSHSFSSGTATGVVLAEWWWLAVVQ